MPACATCAVTAFDVVWMLLGGLSAGAASGGRYVGSVNLIYLEFHFCLILGVQRRQQVRILIYHVTGKAPLSLIDDFCLTF